MRLASLESICLLLYSIPVQSKTVTQKWLLSYEELKIDIHRLNFLWAFIVGDIVPEQSDGKNNWCVQENGKEIDYTRAKKEGFPFDCQKTRECPIGTVYETSGRCDATCGQVIKEGFELQFHCRNKCICPRGQFRNNEKKCVLPNECPEPICKPPMKFSYCVSKCQRTCANQQLQCGTSCAEGIHCECPYGMVLINNRSRSCLKIEDCPKCGYGSIPTDCSPRCPNTCFENKSCDGCEEGVHCTCPPGKLRLDNKLPVRCVMKDRCPSKCAPPRVFKKCDTACPPTCDNPKPQCTDRCESEIICSCPEGHVQRSSTNKTCITFEDCRKERFECQSPAIPVKCTSSCPPSCEGSAGPACFRRCKSDSEYVCGCPDGYVQRSRDNDTCIRANNCPPVCKFPKLYEECASLCQPTCQAPEKSSSCRRGCSTQLCVCPDGMVQLSKENSICLDPSECPICESLQNPAICTTTCPATCDGTDSFCARACHSKYVCTCPDGYVQRSLNDTRCVKPKNCPAKCVPPRVLKGCGTVCPPTCNDPKPNCSDQCSPENICTCPAGYVQRSTTNRTCVTLMHCQKERLECQAPSKPVKCTASCPRSCEGSTGPACLRRCNPDSNYVCGCQDGYVQRSRDNDTCIRSDDCPPLCESPKAYMECASFCQPTCQAPNKPASCRRGCSSQVCVCPKDMVQLSRKNSICVHLSKCPKNCTAPKIYNQCPSKCQPTCENLKPNVDKCDSGCLEDVCVCPKRMVLLNETSDKCVTLSQCPKSCKFPEVRTFCRSTCPVNCDNLSTFDVQECGVECVEAFCACADGYLPKSKFNSTCVPASSCPLPPTQSNLPQIRCKFPEVLANCRTTCSVRCDNLATLDVQDCDVECGEEFCACADGYIQKSESNSTCVPVASCPLLLA